MSGEVFIVHLKMGKEKDKVCYNYFVRAICNTWQENFLPSPLSYAVYYIIMCMVRRSCVHGKIFGGVDEMKKAVLLVMIAVCMMVSVEPVFAAYTDGAGYGEDYSAYSKAKRAKADAFFKKIGVLRDDVEKLADKIVKYNKPAFEGELPKSERAIGNDFILWNRVWVKDNTIVIGCAGRDKKFYAFYLITSDPNFTFSGGIRVGASTKVVERFFADTMNNMGVVKGKTVVVSGPPQEGPDAYPIVQFTCVNGIITEITYGFFNLTYAVSKKALNFANNHARQMGLSTLK